MKYGILNIKWSQVHVFNSSTLEADLFELEASLVYILNSRTVENYIVKPYLNLKKKRACWGREPLPLCLACWPEGSQSLTDPGLYGIRKPLTKEQQLSWGIMLILRGMQLGQRSLLLSPESTGQTTFSHHAHRLTSEKPGPGGQSKVTLAWDLHHERGTGASFRAWWRCFQPPLLTNTLYWGSPLCDFVQTTSFTTDF